LEKTPTGINGFDDMVLGGIVRGNSVLIEGIPGAGKTTFGIEFIYRGITEFGEPGLIVTCEELPESIYRDASTLVGFRLERPIMVYYVFPEVWLFGGGLMKSARGRAKRILV
jgi:KaiC/GvpD/RAD55 family RecA-like ATPase